MEASLAAAALCLEISAYAVTESSHSRLTLECICLYDRPPTRDGHRAAAGCAPWMDSRTDVLWSLATFTHREVVCASACIIVPVAATSSRIEGDFPSYWFSSCCNAGSCCIQTDKSVGWKKTNYGDNWNFPWLVANEILNDGFSSKNYKHRFFE